MRKLEKLTNIIESLLYISGKEVSIVDIAEKLEISKNEVKLAVMELQQKYSGECGLHLLVFNDKVQFGSNPEYGDAVSAVLNPIRERELSTSLLETAAIIAYKQPVTRAELEELRGVSSDYAVQRLLSLGLIEVVGHKDAIGRPSLLGTTDKFLKRFQISSLEDLPDYDTLMENVKAIQSGTSNYLYQKDVYIDDGSDDNMPPQNQFKAKISQGEMILPEEIQDIKNEEIPDFLKSEDVELMEVGLTEDDDDDIDIDDGEDFDESDEIEDDDDFEEYSIDDEDAEFEDEDEDDSDYDDDEIEQDDGYEEDDI